MRRRKRRHPNGLTQDDFDKALALLYPADGPAAPSEADLTGVPFDWESLSAGDRDMLLSANRDDGQRLSASRWQPDHRAAAVLYGEADLPQASAATMMLDAPQLTHVQKTPSDITERPNTSQVHSSRGSSRGSGSFLSRFAASLCILAGLVYWGGAQWYYAASGESTTQTRHEQKAIEDVEFHDRLSGYNPLPFDTRRDAPEPTPETHREVVLELIKQDGSLLEMRFSRSLEWIEAEGAAPGETIFLDLPEFGALGEAEVLAISPCPPTPPGSGNLVTGAFEHEADDVIDLYLAGTNEPIGCTDNHRFWSDGRKDYVEAGRLRQGERVRTRALAITATVSRPGTHRVYNLEVHGEHLYEVGELGTLVHNEYPLYGVSGPAHHIVSHLKSSHRFRWSKAAQELLNDAGSNVKRSNFNKVRLPGHEGPHLELYPRRVPERLDEATTGVAPGSTLYKERVMHELRDIAKDVLADPRKLSGIGP